MPEPEYNILFVEDFSFSMISRDHFPFVGACMDQNAGTASTPERKKVRNVFTSGPPLVGARAVYEMSNLVKTLGYMKDGDVLDHPWGYARRISDGFMLAYPRQKRAEGNWCSDNSAAIANQMFEQYMLLQGIQLT